MSRALDVYTRVGGESLKISSESVSPFDVFGQRQIYQGQNNVKRTFVLVDCGGGHIYQGQITLQ